MNHQPAKRIEPKPAINRYETTPKPSKKNRANYQLSFKFPDQAEEQ